MEGRRQQPNSNLAGRFDWPELAQATRANVPNAPSPRPRGRDRPNGVPGATTGQTLQHASSTIVPRKPFLAWNRSKQQQQPQQSLAAAAPSSVNVSPVQPELMPPISSLLSDPLPPIHSGNPHTYGTEKRGVAAGHLPLGLSHDFPPTASVPTAALQQAGVVYTKRMPHNHRNGNGNGGVVLRRVPPSETPSLMTAWAPAQQLSLDPPNQSQPQSSGVAAAAGHSGHIMEGGKRQHGDGGGGGQHQPSKVWVFQMPHLAQQPPRDGNGCALDLDTHANVSVPPTNLPPPQSQNVSGVTFAQDDSDNSRHAVAQRVLEKTSSASRLRFGSGRPAQRLAVGSTAVPAEPQKSKASVKAGGGQKPLRKEDGNNWEQLQVAGNAVAELLPTFHTTAMLNHLEQCVARERRAREELAAAHLQVQQAFRGVVTAYFNARSENETQPGAKSAAARDGLRNTTHVSTAKCSVVVHTLVATVQSYARMRLSMKLVALRRALVASGVSGSLAMRVHMSNAHAVPPALNVDDLAICASATPHSTTSRVTTASDDTSSSCHESLLDQETIARLKQLYFDYYDCETFVLRPSSTQRSVSSVNVLPDISPTSALQSEPRYARGQSLDEDADLGEVHEELILGDTSSPACDTTRGDGSGSGGVGGGGGYHNNSWGAYPCHPHRPFSDVEDQVQLGGESVSDSYCYRSSEGSPQQNISRREIAAINQQGTLEGGALSVVLNASLARRDIFGSPSSDLYTPMSPFTDLDGGGPSVGRVDGFV